MSRPRCSLGRPWADVLRSALTAAARCALRARLPPRAAQGDRAARGPASSSAATRSNGRRGACGSASHLVRISCCTRWPTTTRDACARIRIRRFQPTAGGVLVSATVLSFMFASERMLRFTLIRLVRPYLEGAIVEPRTAAECFSKNSQRSANG